MKACYWVVGAFILILSACTETGNNAPYKGTETKIFLGSGGTTGVYYPTAGAICRLVNQRRSRHGIKCAAESTGGSVYNINSIRSGELDMAIAQSDWQYHAYRGTGKASFRDAGPFLDLRSVFSVHPEPVAVLARADSGIATVGDLVGKRVSVGVSGSGTRNFWESMWKKMGYSYGDLKETTGLKSPDTPKALCDNRIDAFFWLVGNPSGINKQTTTMCDAVFARVEGTFVNELVSEYSYLRKAVIPGGVYPGNPDDVPTFGVGATFIASTAVSDETVYQVVKAVFENFQTFKRLHPAFARLRKSEMIKDSLTAPLHAGAIRYYKEAGLM